MTSPSARTSTRSLHLLLAGAAAILLPTLPLADSSSAYDIDDIATPAGLDSQVGGLDFMPDGRLVACFHRGEIYTWNPDSGEWRLFASGLQEPLGIVAVDNHEVVVVQRPELTRVLDLDRDGSADTYATLYDGFGMTGNYHEFAFGPARDRDGNFYIGLNTASNGASVRPEVRGDWIDIGLPRDAFYNRPWGEVKNQAGRMYSRVPWRGWVLKVSPDGHATPFASGFRSPDGLGFDAQGRLLVTDNQGDWLGTSKCFHVEEGGFYGHPASLVWRQGWSRDPLEVPVDELESMRTRAAFLFPQGDVANSPTQPIVIPESGAFGPYAGQLLVGEMNVPRLLRLIPDSVNGRMQGAVAFFLNEGTLTRGNHRMAFDREGTLYVGKTALSWAGASGLQRVRWNGSTPVDVLSIHHEPDGFRLTFTTPMDTAALARTEAFPVRAYTYHYHRNYGSPKVDEHPVPVTSVEVAADGLSVTLRFAPDSLRSGYIHEFRFSDLRSSDGRPIATDGLWYHLVEVL